MKEIIVKAYPYLSEAPTKEGTCQVEVFVNPWRTDELKALVYLEFKDTPKLRSMLRSKK